MSFGPTPSGNTPPFGGEFSEGSFWGRGAIDAKSLGMAHLEALGALATIQERSRDVIFLAVADEERGGAQGTEFLLTTYPELFEDIGAVLNEGGANKQVNGRLLWFGVEFAQKRPLWLRLTSHGRGGHAATYNPGSAVHLLIQGLGRLLEMPSPWHVSPPVRTSLEVMAPLQNDHWNRLFGDIDSVITTDGPSEHLMPGMESLFTDTLQVTRLEGSSQINSVSSQATAEVDLRLLPDSDDREVLSRVRDALGKRIQVEVLVSAPPSAPSPIDSPAFQLIESVLSPEAPVLPVFSPGFTDSRFFRERSTPAYGLSPFTHEPQDLRGIHASDEHISLETYLRGVSRMQALVERWVSR